jgi:hypothetical protein
LPSTADKRITVKRYADGWLAVKMTKLSPKGYNAAAGRRETASTARCRDG